MTSNVASKRIRNEDDEQCLVRSVATALAAEPLLEAVTFDRTRDSISVATLGRKDNTTVEAQATAAVQKGRLISEQHE